MVLLPVVAVVSVVVARNVLADAICPDEHEHELGKGSAMATAAPSGKGEIPCGRRLSARCALFFFFAEQSEINEE